MALFVYTQRSTLLHRLHPASKAVWVIAMGIILSIYFDPLPLLVLFLINLPFFLLGKLPWRSWSKPFGYVVLLGLIGYFITSLWLARPGVFTRYPGLVGVSLWQIAGAFLSGADGGHHRGADVHGRTDAAEHHHGADDRGVHVQHAAE